MLLLLPAAADAADAADNNDSDDMDAEADDDAEYQRIHDRDVSINPDVSSRKFARKHGDAKTGTDEGNDKILYMGCLDAYANSLQLRFLLLFLPL